MTFSSFLSFPNMYLFQPHCHKCKEYGHTKKQCDRHNKIVKQISKLEFEKDIINGLMEIFHVKQKEIDQVMKWEKIKSTNPLKINKKEKKTKRHNNKTDRKSTESP